MIIPVIAFRAENCALIKINLQMAMMVYQATHGDPCITGCVHFKRGGCPSYQRFRQLPTNFDQQVLGVPRTTPGMLALTLHLATMGVNSPGVPVALHLLTAEDPLQIPDAGNMWKELKKRYPTEDHGIDCEKLAIDVHGKLKELGF